MRSAIPPRSMLRAAALLAAGLLAACGSARKVEGEVPLCVRCHGDAARNTAIAGVDPGLRAAPPLSVSGATATTDPKVGAHQAHLVAGRLRGPLPCSACHVVPADMQAHEAQIAAVAAGSAQRVTFGAVGSIAPAGAWDPATATCSGTYCHGSTLDRGGLDHAPLWTGTASQATCTSCHGYPPANTHAVPGTENCNGCHPATVAADNATIVIAADGSSTHIDGRPTVAGLICTGTCTTCHGAPPATGAHLAHVTTTATTYGVDSKTADTSATAATTYDFGCGNCHPTDCAKHATGLVDLSPVGATAGSLKARNDPAAAYTPGATPGTGTCSGVYCHSSGQATPAYVTTPAWSSTTPLGCDGCHADPPSYANGGAGAATANSHVGWLLDGSNVLATGHFAGLPAALHEGSAHGGGTGTEFAGDSAAPLTCQTCHYLTADPANTGPSAFYYLDTSGTYRPAADWAGTPATPVVLSCAACHTGAGAPPTGVGRTRPYYHVNGTREVALDPRTDLAGMDAVWAAANLPAAPNAPTRPYWYTRATTNNISGTASPVVAGIAGRTDAGFDGTTLSLHLGDATWDGSTKTCTNVACHYNRTSAQWGEPLSAATCSVCHNQ